MDLIARLRATEQYSAIAAAEKLLRMTWMFDRSREKEYCRFCGFLREREAHAPECPAEGIE